MNAQRRKAVREVLAKIGSAKAELETLRDEEQDYFDSMPESFQEGQKGESAQEIISALESFIEAIETSSEEVEGVLE